MRKKISNIATIGAFIMALSCTIKITAFHFNLPLVAQWVNVIMNAAIVIGCYALGRMVGLSRNHRLLCGTALIGYIFYGFILLYSNSSDSESISIGVLAFFILTLFMSTWFLIRLVLDDLKHTKENLENLERRLKE